MTTAAFACLKMPKNHEGRNRTETLDVWKSEAWGLVRRSVAVSSVVAVKSESDQRGIAINKNEV